MTEQLKYSLDTLESTAVPTAAAMTGHCLGARLAIAAVCDLRVADRSARFGVPIAKTLGQCLSINTCSLLVARLGRARTLDLLMRARFISTSRRSRPDSLCELCDDEPELDPGAAVMVSLAAGSCAADSHGPKGSLSSSTHSQPARR